MRGLAVSICEFGKIPQRYQCVDGRYPIVDRWYGSRGIIKRRGILFLPAAFRPFLFENQLWQTCGQIFEVKISSHLFPL